MNSGCHVMAKLNGGFNKVLRKVLLNKVLAMKTAAIAYIQTNIAWRMKMKKKGQIPPSRQKKSGTCNQTRRDIQWTTRLFSHIQKQKWQGNRISCKILCCFGFTINFKLRESTHSKTGNANMCVWECPWCFAPNLLPQHIQSVDISSCAWHTAPSVLCMREGSLDRNVRDAEDRTFQWVSKFSRLNPQYSGAINTKMSSFHSLLLLAPNRLYVFTKKRCSGHQCSQQSYLEAQGGEGELFWRYTGQWMFVNGGKASKTPIHYNMRAPPRVLSNFWQNVTLHILCRFFIRQGGRV